MKNKPKSQRFLSSNGHYSIKRYDASKVEFYGLNQHSSLYDLADAIYNYCDFCSDISTPLRCEVSFYNSRNYVFYFLLTNYRSTEDILKELSKQLYL